MTQYATTKEIAAMLCVGVRTVARLRDRGMPHVKLDRSVRFIPTDVQRWIDRNASKGGGRVDKRLRVD